MIYGLLLPFDISTGLNVQNRFVPVGVRAVEWRCAVHISKAIVKPWRSDLVIFKCLMHAKIAA